MSTVERGAKFIGFAFLDALRDLGLLPETDRFLDCVTIEARVDCFAIIQYRYRLSNARFGVEQFKTETSYLAWETLAPVLVGAGLMEDSSWIRSVTIVVPNDRACTITHERFASSDVIDVFANSALRLTEDKDEALAGRLTERAS